ncbi:PAS domain-containing protein [Tardiphaga sp.]|jgi:methyl-accepting chemotaxis protein|uniref:methyl-accepting chemotaxis protein n=1 Tax=Tardiphaga sp. TaxID=1926292 RepID=UPI0037DA33E2
MVDLFRTRRQHTMVSQAEAIHRSQAVAEYLPDGTVVDASRAYLEMFGYSLPETAGRHHEMFVPSSVRESRDYRGFWSGLAQGESTFGHYKRIAKDGREIWIQACYCPLTDKAGRCAGVVEVAMEITPERQRAIDADGKVAAIDRAQAVIEFAIDGTILTANGNFLKTVGYGLDEIRGRHHRMFVPLNEAESPAYAEFWDGLAEGRYDAGEYKRIGKGGRELWLLATYNPIFDETGKPFKVLKFATDVTQQKMTSVDLGGQIAAIEKSQAVIEFCMDGTIIRANQNFLDAVGYSLDEIVGRHHRMFVDPAERVASSYTEFWADLNRGNYRADEYRRIGKGGRELWIQASYNPILDLNGKPFKVVKYATDTTALAIGRMKASRAHSLIESVAAGSEEMSASIQEISQTMSKSRRTAAEAAELVGAADRQASRLNDAAQAMGGIVELIGNITSQINLLALNATIESARAGESGRGFAVVASEVKNLANQAKQATDKITDEIAGLNGVSGDVVSALSGIKRAIEDVREFVNSTAAAVEEQSAVTADMSVNMQRAAAELS